MIDITKRKGKLPFYQPYVATAADAAAGESMLIVRLPEGILTLVNCIDFDTLTTMTLILRPRNYPFDDALTLFLWEAPIAKEFDVTWEGEQYVPEGWEIVVRFRDVAAGDKISVHGGIDLCQ